MSRSTRTADRGRSIPNRRKGPDRRARLLFIQIIVYIFLDAVIHRKFYGMSCLLEGMNLVPFEFYVAVDDVVGEDVTLLEEVPVPIERIKRLAQ